jgi:amidase
MDDAVILDVNDMTAPLLRLSVYAGVATLSGHPGTAFPFGLTRSGLPIGLQAVGPYLEDRTPIRFTELVGIEFGGYHRPAGYENT